MSNLEAKLKTCPFCGDIPELPSGDGTQYEIECGCGMAVSSIQIRDLMTIKEIGTDSFCRHRYPQQFIDRAMVYAIKQWNERSI